MAQAESTLRARLRLGKSQSMHWQSACRVCFRGIRQSCAFCFFAQRCWAEVIVSNEEANGWCPSVFVWHQVQTRFDDAHWCPCGFLRWDAWCTPPGGQKPRRRHREWQGCCGFSWQRQPKLVLYSPLLLSHVFPAIDNSTKKALLVALHLALRGQALLAQVSKRRPFPR